MSAIETRSKIDAPRGGHTLLVGTLRYIANQQLYVWRIKRYANAHHYNPPHGGSSIYPKCSVPLCIAHCDADADTAARQLLRALRRLADRLRHDDDRFDARCTEIERCSELAEQAMQVVVQGLADDTETPAEPETPADTETSGELDARITLGGKRYHIEGTYRAM